MEEMNRHGADMQSKVDELQEINHLLLIVFFYDLFIKVFFYRLNENACLKK
jgi:hypothetical protein